ncbi:CENPF protein, partial [Centropus unirufus]|nr:CENPF protein [Centropus unirufus]
DENAIPEEMKLKLEETQESTEVKTREADKYSGKYHSLLAKYYKLEEENEILKTQISLLSALLKDSTSDTVSASLQNSPKSLTASSESVKEMRSNEDATRPSRERQKCKVNRRDNGESRSPVLESSPKEKRKAGICQNLLDQEDTYYEPDGLPEVVKKGFADIPSGKGSPYILRRTSLN